MNAYNFLDVATLPGLNDNLAIARQNLEPGTEIKLANGSIKLSHGVMEGHRFTVTEIAKGHELLSWGLPFGKAISDIKPGDYALNESMKRELASWSVPYALPEQPNFKDYRRPASIEDAKFGDQVQKYMQDRQFMGFSRGERGVGIRNYVAVLPITSASSGFADYVASMFNDTSEYRNVDGVVSAAHTESSGNEFLLRTLAGFTVHPNLGGILLVNHPGSELKYSNVEDFMREHEYPTDGLEYRVVTQGLALNQAVPEAQRRVVELLQVANKTERTSQSVSNLKFALQCGGSDAFSGVTGNPLLGIIARELIRYGSTVNLTETDELMGAESYILANVKDLATAQKFLYMLQRFDNWAALHGHSAEGNPSGGNKFRGLYDIAVKSIGAAMKKHQDLRLDCVIEYAERMLERGFYFMDGPGNDLEGIAGQVASGATMIGFTTGNGSISNFPFVPTVKIMTTSRKYNEMPNEMDINAGRCIDQVSLEREGLAGFNQLLRVASGEKTSGENAGHSKLQIWRQSKHSLATGKPTTDATFVSHLREAPYVILTGINDSNMHFTSEQYGIIIPTSLCSSQVAPGIVQNLNDSRIGYGNGISAWVALPHTEGCGSADSMKHEDGLNAHYRLMLSNASHPRAGAVLFLQHGCEKDHNGKISMAMESIGINPEDFGWASCQMVGGLEAAASSIREWASTVKARGSESGISLGIYSPVESAYVNQSALDLTRAILGLGRNVIVPSNAAFLNSDYFRNAFNTNSFEPTLRYAQITAKRGFQVMEMPTRDPVETFTGLGAAVHSMIIYNNGPVLPPHPFVPIVQVAADENTVASFGNDYDVLRPSKPRKILLQLSSKSRKKPTLLPSFQIARMPDQMSV